MRVVLLVVMLAWVLLPAIGLAVVWPEFGLVLGSMFPDRLAHTVGHFALHFLLGLVILATFPQIRVRFWPYCALMVLIALVQEALQAPFKQVLFTWDSAYDLVVDSLGALCAWTVSQVLVGRWKRVPEQDTWSR